VSNRFVAGHFDGAFKAGYRIDQDVQTAGQSS
jgi:hypothetical protein